MIGIAISTHNRHETFKKTYDSVQQYLPPNAKCVVVDDASNIPVQEADYRFESNVGIAKTKNKCLELLQDCEHIFLFDDDTYPIHPDWYKPYIESQHPHLCYCFKSPDASITPTDREDIIVYSKGKGCMIYLTQQVLQTVGGFDTTFGQYGFEHLQYSRRVYNANLIPHPYIDIPDSSQYIHSLDEHKQIKSSVKSITKLKQYISNKVYYETTMPGYLPFQH